MPEAQTFDWGGLKMRKVCAVCRWVSCPSDGPWGKPTLYCGNEESEWNGLVIPDTETCEKWENGL